MRKLFLLSLALLVVGCAAPQRTIVVEVTANKVNIVKPEESEVSTSMRYECKW